MADPVEELREIAVLDELQRVAKEIISQDGENPIATGLLVDRAEELVEHLNPPEGWKAGELEAIL